MKKNTYCNPVPFQNMPQGIDEKLCGVKDTEDDYCSVADPDGYFYDGKCYLFTSYGGAWYTEDMVNWKRHYLEGINEDYYAPAVLEFKGKFYFTAGRTDVYVADEPFGSYRSLGRFKDIAGDEQIIEDPDLFLDDDGKVYLFWGCGVESGIMGVRLCEDDITQFAQEPVRIISFNPDHKWERWGEYNQDKDVGWTEGACMIKRDGRYYLCYAACGTTYSTYASGVYYSDKSPLEGFVYQKNNPVMGKRYGLMRGGGHPCIIENKDEMWAFTTCICGYSHRFERVVGMDRVYVRDGELYCTVTDIPCDFDGSMRDDMLPLTFLSPSKASSNAPGREARYAFDDSMQSFWQPADDDENPYIEVSLRGEYFVKAFRIIRRCPGICFEKNILPEAFSYKVLVKNTNGEWIVVADKLINDEVKMIDYVQIEETVGTDVRLVFEKSTVNNAIISFTAFGSK